MGLCRLYELKRILDVSRPAVYIIVIYKAHYFDLNHSINVPGFQTQCGNNHYDLTKIWQFFELEIFYSYMLTAIFFLWIAQIFKLNKANDI
jgi:hypothetical protein